MDAAPSHAKLGAALRGAAATSRKFGDANRWRPSPSSRAAEYWRAAARSEDPLKMTLTEADVHAVLLIRSAITHADEIGRTISARRPFLPDSVGRIALEHALRALHLMEENAEPVTRAQRRLDDLLYAMAESDRQRAGFAKKTGLEPGGLGDTTELLKQVEERAEALGFTIVTNAKGTKRVSERGRASTMALAETYLAGVYPGVPEFLLRGHGAIIHGVETALLASTVDQFDPDTGINMPAPVAADAPMLALSLLALPLALDNAFRAVGNRFEWPASGKPWQAWDRARDGLLDTWQRAVEAVPEDDTEPPAIGLFGTAT